MEQIFTKPVLHKQAKQWYIEYYIVPKGSKVRERVRVFKGINSGTIEERERAAAKLLEQLQRKMKDGTLKGARTVENVLVATAERSFTPNLVVTKSNKDTLVALNEYLEQVKLRVKYKSYQTYKSILYKFSLYIRAEYDGIYYTYLTRKHLIDYLASLAKSGLCRTTIKKNTQVLHNFFKWLYENEKIAQNIAVNLPTNFGKVKDYAPRPLSHENIARFKSVIYGVDKQLWLACLFQYYAAIRPAELRGIKLRDIDVERKQVILHCENTKNNKNDIVRLHNVLLQYMRDLGYFSIDNKDLFLFGAGGFPNFIPVAKNSLYNRFKKIAEMLNMPPHITLYSWKHTGAIDAINNGMPPFELKEHLRHASFATTEIYLKNKTRLPKDNDAFFCEI